MKYSVLRRCTAFLSACFMFLAAGCPVFAAGSETKEYIVDEIVLQVPQNENAVSEFAGPDVNEDGTITLKYGEKYNFTWTGEIPDLGSYGEGWGPTFGYQLVYDYGDDAYRDDEVCWLEDDRWFSRQIPLNDRLLFGRILDGEGATVTIDFIDVSLGACHADEEEPIVLEGRYEIEVRMRVDRTYQMYAEDFSAEAENPRGVLRYALRTMPSRPEAEEVVYHISYDGVGSAKAQNGRNRFSIYSCYLDRFENYSWDWTIEYAGETIPMNKVSEDIPNAHFDISTYFDFQVLSWELIECPECDNMLGVVAATTAGAAAVGLGGTAVSNVLSGIQPSGSAPAESKREDEEEETDDEQDFSLLEDSPGVSMSIYKPFDALVNTKGAAADLSITIKGGEEFVWRYIPTAICPGGLKSVILSVVGKGHESTLVIALTGAPMEESHCNIYINVVAVAKTSEGKLLKTSGSTEILLHRKGLEAKWADDGQLKVKSYSDGNLDGIAEIRELASEEYTCTPQEDGTILIEAKEKHLGQCILEVKED